MPAQGNTTRLPRRGQQRIAFFEWLWAVIELDALATVDELRSSGWPEQGIGDAMDGYRSWIEGNVADAVELALIAGGVAG